MRLIFQNYFFFPSYASAATTYTPELSNKRANDIFQFFFFLLSIFFFKVSILSIITVPDFVLKQRKIKANLASNIYANFLMVSILFT